MRSPSSPRQTESHQRSRTVTSRPGRHAILSLGLTIVFGGATTAQTVPQVPQGFPNTNQTAGALLTNLMVPTQGRTAILAYHNGTLYTVPEIPSSQPNSDFLVRTWDLSNLAGPPGANDPVLVNDTFGVTPMPINAHGYLKSGDYLVLGSNWPPESPWSFRYDDAGAGPAYLGPGSTTRTTYPDLLCAGVRGCLFQPWFVGDTYWSYGEVGGNASLSQNWSELSDWDHLALTGVIGHPFLIGDLLIFASDQSRTGVATYDISDPTNPVLLDVLTAGGAGGYWPEVWGGDGKLYVVFPYRTGGNGIRVVDATDPSNLQFVADTALSGDEAMYIQFQDEYAFVGSHKVDMRTFQSVLELDETPYLNSQIGLNGVDTSQFLLPLGNLVVTGGVGPHQGMAVWAHQATPDTRGPSVGYHRPLAGQSNYPVDLPISLLIHETLESPTIVNGESFIVRPVGGSPIAGRLTLAFDDILTFTPAADLAADTTYEVVLPAGGIKDAAGNGMEEYSFTFSTGSSVGGNQAPEITAIVTGGVPAAPDATVTLDVTATDPDARGASLEYRWDFGDGSPKTAWSSTSSETTSYADAGHYRVTAQVRDSSGAVASDSVTVTVVAALPALLPSASSQTACDASARRIWTVNPDNDTVTVLHADTLGKLSETPVCDDPRSLARVGNEVWVTCFDSDELSILDATSAAELERLALGYGSGPQGLVSTADGATVFVALESRGELLRLDAATGAETGRLPLGPTPRALALSGDGTTLLVTRFQSPKFRAEIWEVDTTTFTVADTWTIEKFGGDLHRDGTADGRGVANELAAIAIDPFGDHAWVAAKKANVDGGQLNGQDIDQDNSVRNLAVLLDLATGSVVKTFDIDNSASSSAIAFSPLGDYAFVALQGNDEVLVVDTLVDVASSLGGIVTRLGVGAAPQGLCIDDDTSRLFTKNFMDRDVTVSELSGLFATGSKSVASQDVSTVASEDLPADVLTGKRIFYGAGDPRMSAEGYMSCATCHLDGGHDGRVWDFTSRGEGLRNTTTLRGRGGTAQGNVHWSANFDEIHDFEHDIRGAFGGSGFLSDTDFAATSDPLGTAKAGLSTDLDALAAYVTSLDHESVPRSPFRNVDGSMTSAAMRGAAVFTANGCDTCHAGPELTDSTLGAPTLHDVGTLRTSSGSRLGAALNGIDTPSLLGLWNGAPYLHDGSAPTLDDVFRIAGGVNLQAEDHTTGNGANVVTQWVDLNNDSTPRNQSFVDVSPAGAEVEFSGVDGGAGGLGAIEVRYSSGYGNHALEIWVNGVQHDVILPNPLNVPQWRQTNWDVVRVDGVTFTAGTGNTVRIVGPGNNPVSIDEIVVASPDELTAAFVHRRVDGLSSGDHEDLMQYLLQLDGAPAGGPALIFADGFESGNTAAW